MRQIIRQEGRFQLNASVFYRSARLITRLTAFVLILSLCSCGIYGTESTTAPYEEETQAQIPGGSLSIPYISTDSLNPFYCKTVLNSALSSLVYRTLYRLDNSFTPVKDLAVSESISGLILKVFIEKDLVFSDGGVLTSEDVKYSFDCAVRSDRYSALLSGISSCETSGTDCVIFNLKYADPNVLNALIFPIVKNLSSAAPEFFPKGNGYYEYHQDGIRLSLKANLKYAGDLPAIGTVRLTDVKGNTSPENLITTNEIDFCYSELSGANVTDINCSSMGIYLNNLIYLGVNHENVNLVLASFRQALSFAVDRQAIAENAFRGFARAAAVPFNTSWEGYSSSLTASNISFAAQPEKTQALLSERGFGTDGIPMELVLVCSESNGFIRNTAAALVSAFAPFNINVTVNYMNPSDLKKTVEAGEYDLYIGEIKIPATMNISALMSSGGAAAYGINYDYLTCDEEYERYKNGEISLDDFLAAFSMDMPFIPLVYRNGRFLYTRNVTSEIFACEGFLFSELYKWTFSDSLF